MTELSPAERAALVDDIVADAARLPELIDAPLALRPSAQEGSDYWVTVDFYDEHDGHDVSEYRYTLWAREGGSTWEIAEAGLRYREEFLSEIFETITHVIAMDALGNPKPGAFDRADLFRRQQALLRVLNGAWADAIAIRHANLLSR